MKKISAYFSLKKKQNFTPFSRERTKIIQLRRQFEAFVMTFWKGLQVWICFRHYAPASRWHESIH